MISKNEMIDNLEKEVIDMSVKCKDLRSFFYSGYFNKQSDLDYRLAKMQLQALENYISCLQFRIDNLNKKVT